VPPSPDPGGGAASFQAVARLRIADSVGRVLGGRYRLNHPLGTGASAHVYVAEDVRLGRRVAVKILHPGLADDEAFLRSFESEAHVVATLQHPNILHVYDHGEDGGSAYIVTELLAGGSLRALLDRGHLLTPSQATAVAFGVAEALDHAHRRGFVHRDIKPANLLFDDEGRVVLADFGLAQALAAATWTQQPGELLGTARYAAPEQARGHPLGARADIYALALVLTEATTGVLPFVTDTALGTLMARLEDPLRVPPPGAGPLGAVLEAAGAVEPGDRLDAAGLVRALEAVAAELPPPTPLPLAGLPAGGAVDRDGDPTELGARPRRGRGAGDLPTVLVDRRSTVGPDWGAPLDLPPPPPAPLPPAAAAPAAAAPAAAAPAAAAPAPARTAPARTGVAGTGAAGTGVAGTGVAGTGVAGNGVAGNGVAENAPARTAGAAAHPGPGGPEVGPVPPPGVGPVVAPPDEAAATKTGGDRSRGHRGRVLAGVVVLVVVVAGGVTGWVVTHRPVPLEAVPLLHGRSEAQAAAVLARRHLVLDVVGRSYDSAPKGTVTGQAPASGRLREHATVTVTVSLGPEPVRVPPLGGTSVADAERLIRAVGLVVGRVTTTTSVTVAAGDVISAAPATGRLLPGQHVDLVVSTGKPTVTVPLLAGPSVQSYSAAAAALRGAHLAPAEELAYSDSVPAGEVVTTDPAPHARALYGAAVTVVVSKGPDLVAVPDVTGDSVARADAVLGADGFDVTGVTGNPNDRVVATTPAAGQSVLAGSRVQIVTR
jgi:serine/threonine protein kinase/beta-lactam-binding protein with PASTA domain